MSERDLERSGQWSGEHRAALHRYVTDHCPDGGAMEPGPRGAGAPTPHTDGHGGDLPPASGYRVIRHGDGRIHYDGEPLTLADAQLRVNDGIAAGDLAASSFLRVEGDVLVIEHDVDAR